MAIYNENEDIIFCAQCGADNKKSAHICQKCKKEIVITKERNHYKVFFERHIKSEAKERATDSAFELIRKFIFSHLYGTILTVSIVATVAVSAVSTISYSKPVNISIPITATQQEQPEPEPEVEEPELTKESPAYDFIGKTLGEVREVWGTEIETGNYNGGIYFIFPDSPTFFTPNMLRNPQNSDKINAVSVNDDLEILPGVTGNSTFPEIQAAFPDKELKKPERTYNEMEGEWDYGLVFNHEGSDVMCTWYEDPDTNSVSHIQIIKR